jgi:hypothetical protein
MSTWERESFLSEVQVGIVGIDEKNRSPRIVPLWYSFDPKIGITIIVKETSKKLKLLKLAMRFSLCVQKATLPYKHVSVQGPIVDVRPCDDLIDLPKMVYRYMSAIAGAEYLNKRPAENSVVLVMKPEKWITADYTGVAG